MKKKKIFRKDKFILDMLNNTSKDDAYECICTLALSLSPDGWAAKCDGKEAINGRIGRYIVFDDWCEVVENEN